MKEPAFPMLVGALLAAIRLPVAPTALLISYWHSGLVIFN
jgi:hypothetical protein